MRDSAFLSPPSPFSYLNTGPRVACLSFEDIAKSEGVVPSYATRLFRLTLLAPDIVSAILSGRHPPELTARRLMDDTRLPLEWNEQRQRLGFASVR